MLNVGPMFKFPPTPDPRPPTSYPRPPTPTKPEEQKRRAAKRSSADIETAGQRKATVCHTCFLENPHNRQRLIKAASESVQAAGIDVKQAVSDAGIQIVSTAIRHAAEGRSVIVNEKDADLLVMLAAGAPTCSTVYRINPGHRRVPRKAFRVSVIQEAA